MCRCCTACLVLGPLDPDERSTVAKVFGAARVVAAVVLSQLGWCGRLEQVLTGVVVVQSLKWQPRLYSSCLFACNDAYQAAGSVKKGTGPPQTQLPPKPRRVSSCQLPANNDAPTPETRFFDHYSSIHDVCESYILEKTRLCCFCSQIQLNSSSSVVGSRLAAESNITNSPWPAARPVRQSR